MYSGRSSSMGPLPTILAESANLVPEDHIPMCNSAYWTAHIDHFIITIPIVALRLKGYDLLPKLAPESLEIRAVIHMLRARAHEP
jgi:hypothetical protein